MSSNNTACQDSPSALPLLGTAKLLHTVGLTQGEHARFLSTNVGEHRKAAPSFMGMRGWRAAPWKHLDSSTWGPAPWQAECQPAVPCSQEGGPCPGIIRDSMARSGTGLSCSALGHSPRVLGAVSGAKIKDIKPLERL